jgi:hypothetical protein
MNAEVFIDRTESGIEITVLQAGLSSGAAHKYGSVEKARSVLEAFGFESDLIDQQLASVAQMPVSELLKFPVKDIPDEVLRDQQFTAASFDAA